MERTVLLVEGMQAEKGGTWGLRERAWLDVLRIGAWYEGA
jgi:hypothetical protein